MGEWHQCLPSCPPALTWPPFMWCLLLQVDVQAEVAILTALAGSPRACQVRHLLDRQTCRQAGGQ